ncbi:redoxin domain-containing protein [Candidatus Kaiserbacteria bacterium]|nr:redoxin domain-containing protein [Candidatus Kaiserbacteria bacterium]
MNKNTLLIGGAVIVAILLIFVGRFIGGDVPIQNTGGHGAQATAAFLDNQSADSAPDFSLNSLDGRTIKLSDYKGEKPVILDFFATWCPNCQRDMPKLSRMYEQYKDQVEVIGVNLREQEGKVRSFIDSKGIVFPVVLDSAGQVARGYGVQYTNYHVLIGKDGNIVGTVPGDISESHILSLIDSSR